MWHLYIIYMHVENKSFYDFMSSLILSDAAM